MQPKEVNPAATGAFRKGLPLKDGDNPELPLLIEKKPVLPAERAKRVIRSLLRKPALSLRNAKSCLH